MKRKPIQLPWATAEALESVRLLMEGSAVKGKIVVPISDHDNRVSYGTVIDVLCRKYLKERKRKR